MISKLSNFIKTHKSISNALGMFEIKEQLGQGGTSIVRRVIFEDDHEFAIKFLLENITEPYSKAYKRFKQAHINMLSIQHTGAILPQIHLDHLVIDEDSTIPYIIMLKADKTLKDFKNENEISFELFERLFGLMMNILNTIHDHGIIHRDLKPENIFILEEKLVLGDFDIAKFDAARYIKLHDTETKERLANYYFSAPEQSEKSFDEIKISADLYAFGQILYWLITGKTLRGQSLINLTSYDEKYRKYQDVISKLLQHEAEGRFQSTTEIVEHLKNVDKTRQEAIVREQRFKTLRLFDEIIDKYTPDIWWQQFKGFQDKKIINEIMTDLASNVNELSLWWSQGSSDNKVESIKKDNGISTVSQFTSKFVQNRKWLLDSFEIDINSIWIYKYGDIGGSIIIIESNPMPSFGIFNNDYEIEEVALFKNRYISRSNYDNGWTEYKGKKIKVDNAEIRIRFLTETIFFISPWAGPIIGNDRSNAEEITSQIYRKYNENKMLSEDLLAPLKKLKRKPEVATWS